MWKNITIELPKLDLEYLSNELFNLDIISVLIEKKINQINQIGLMMVLTH